MTTTTFAGASARPTGIDILAASDIEPVDVVIVAYGNEAEVGWPVSAGRRLGGKVVVVDHGDGASARRAAAMGAHVVHDPSNPGFGAGQNRGMAETTTDLVLLCNPDARIVPLAVASGARYLREHPEVAAVQGVIRSAGTGRPERSQGVELGSVHLLGRAVGARRLVHTRAGRTIAAHSRRLRDHAQRVPDAPVPVESLAATAMLVRRSAFEAVGGFDPSYFLYGEDLDLCRRLRAAGWTLAALPRPWAVHAGGASSPTSWDRELRWWEGTMTFASRWWARPALAVGRVAAVTACARLALSKPSGAVAAARVAMGSQKGRALRHG